LNGLRSSLLQPGRILLLLALYWPANYVWSQASAQTPAPDPSQEQATPAQQDTEPAGPGSIHGVVVNREGAVLEGAHVSLSVAASTAPPESAETSDSDGSFSFSGVPPGDFKLTVSSSGFVTQVISGVLHSGESYDTQAVVLLLATAASEVQVTATQEEIAEAQIKEEESQRVLGIIPNFYVSYLPNASPLNTKQKFEIAWKTSIDPVSFLAAGAFAGVEQAGDSYSGYGEGAAGYAKRFAANYADSVIGTMIGNAILPSMLKQDPRYFYKGTGSTPSRVLYAIKMSVICKGDNGRWQPNYSAILGGLAAGGISNLYYPADNRDGATLTIENALVGVATGAAQNLFQEFVIRRLTPKLPNYRSSQP
jgi:hypothetical protein